MKKLKKWINNYKLCKKYPFLRIKNVWNGKKLGYSYTELDSMPRGWRKRFGLEICQELSDLFKKSKMKNFDKKYFITQIKEKYGSLRWYDNGVPTDIFEEYSTLMQKYEDLSGRTCVKCGKDATIRNMNGWYEPLCGQCLKEINNRKDD